MESSRSFGDWLVGMSYLAEGQVRLAEGVLRTALTHAESVVGRRSQVAVMLATALASALWERDQPEAVASLLANRLDVIERLAAPEMVASAYTLRARWLALHGQEHRAYDLLESLHSLGERRQHAATVPGEPGRTDPHARPAPPQRNLRGAVSAAGGRGPGRTSRQARACWEPSCPSPTASPRPTTRWPSATRTPCWRI